MWELCYLSAFVLLIIAFALPETYLPKRLHDRKTQSSAHVERLGLEKNLWKTFTLSIRKHILRPMQIMLTRPAVAFANLYTCLIYGLYYTFFECIPRVYIRTYKFSYPEVGLSFLSISIGALVGGILLLPWTIGWMRACVQPDSHIRPERSLVPALYASVIMPASLLLFGEYITAMHIQSKLLIHACDSMDLSSRYTLDSVSCRDRRIYSLHVCDPAMPRQLPDISPPRRRGISLRG